MPSLLSTLPRSRKRNFPHGDAFSPFEFHKTYRRARTLCPARTVWSAQIFMNIFRILHGSRNTRKMLLRGTRHSSCIRPRMEIGGGAHGRARVFAKKERELRIYTYIYIFAYHEENMPRNAPRALKRGWPERGEPTTRGEEEGKEEAEADARVQKKKQLHPVHPTILSLFLSISLFFPLRCWLLRSDSTRLYPSLGYESFCRPFSPQGNDTRYEISRSVYTERGERFSYRSNDCVKPWILNARVVR